MTYDINKTTIRFNTVEDYLVFVKWLSDGHYTNTMFGCSEDVEGYFGVQFGTDHEREYGLETSIDVVEIKCEDIQPREYPCFLLTYCLQGLLYNGRKSSAIKYSDEPVYIYFSDLEK